MFPEFTIEDIERMVKNMHVKTSTGRISDIHISINAILGFFLGRHLLFRTESKVALELSDSFYDEFSTHNGTVPILGFQLATDKSLDEYGWAGISGACRHKNVLMCLVSAFALSLWYRFDFDDQYGPLTGEHVPNFLDKENWYRAKVLFSSNLESTSIHSPISLGYANQLEKIMFDSIVSNYPYAFADRGCQAADDGRYGVDVSESRSASSFAFEFIHFSAGFKKDEQYYITRDIPVPEELQKMIYPWLEEVREQVENRSKEEKERDGAVSEFLAMLQKFRSIIIQDLALLVDIVPESMYCKRPVTTSPLFIEFKEAMEERMKNSSIFPPEIRVSVEKVAPYFEEKIEFVQYGMDQLNANARNHFDAQAMAIRAQNEQFPDMIAKVTKRQVYDVIHHEFSILKNGQREIIKCLKQVDKRQDDLENRVLEMKEYFGAHFQRISDIIMGKETQPIPYHVQTTSITPIQTSQESTREADKPPHEEEGTVRPSKKAKTEDPRSPGSEFDFYFK
ncbi:hypothetical protein JCM33374_g2893 [Metschnikowia sp. JCM 33374]|nr:hypothetical protein JCM33374_g2893 [Metschnikowia sp. JCM 33374]